MATRQEVLRKVLQLEANVKRTQQEVIPELNKMINKMEKDAKRRRTNQGTTAAGYSSEASEQDVDDLQMQLSASIFSVSVDDPRTVSGEDAFRVPV